MESSFTKYTYISTDSKWIVTDKAGTQYYFGLSENSRLSHPNKPSTFAWYLDKAVDVYGNTITYTYEKSDNTIYPKYADYTSNPLCNPQLAADKRIEFVYESTERPDKIYNYRAGWPSIMKRRLEKIRISIDGGVIWTYNLSYILSSDTSRSLLKSIQLSDSAGNTLPAKTFTYQKLEP
jgi:Salmonella virulence plasmid 65kDa B protein